MDAFGLQDAYPFLYFVIDVHQYILEFVFEDPYRGQPCGVCDRFIIQEMPILLPVEVINDHYHAEVICNR